MINFKKGKEHVCRGILEFLYSRFRKEEICLLYTSIVALEAEGSNPSTHLVVPFLIYIYGGIAQLARAHGSYPWCRRFKSYSRYLHGILAQLGEHLPYKQRVTGSSPVGPIS